MSDQRLTVTGPSLVWTNATAGLARGKLVGRALGQQHLVAAPGGHPAHRRAVGLGAELGRAALVPRHLVVLPA